MSKSRDTLLSLTLLILVFSGPAAVAAYMFGGDSSQETVGVVANPSPNSSAAPVLAGVLYTRGTAQVDWNGVKIPVRDGSYAYLGGEVVSTGPGDMGVLRLDGDNTVYMCPGSRMSLTRAQDGAYRIRISQGGGRIAFAAGTDYRIEANRAVFSPAATAAAQPTVAEVTIFQHHPGGVVCGFSSRMDVAGYSSAGDGGPIALGTAGPGQIIDLSRALRDEAAGSGTLVTMQPIPMPASVQSWLRSNAPYPPEPGPIGYLCRCEELKRYAEADGIPDAAIVPRMSPPGTAPLVPQAAAPPAVPPVVLAVPGAPDGADAGVLPNSEAPLTVPPPLIPVRGSGGGFDSTPS